MEHASLLGHSSSSLLGTLGGVEEGRQGESHFFKETSVSQMLDFDSKGFSHLNFFKCII